MRWPALLPPRGDVSRFDRLARAPKVAPPERPPQLVDIERVLAASTTAGGVHLRLRPVLRDVAAHRLRSGHGIELDADPAAARARLGDALFEVVRADRPRPHDPFAPGLTNAAVAGMIATLEEL